jgi:uncharacterized protein
LSGAGSGQSTESVQTPQILLKAFPLKSPNETAAIKEDIKNHTIVILKITPLATKNVEELKTTVEQLTEFALAFGGDIARLGDERIVITPPGVRIWRGGRSDASSGL